MTAQIKEILILNGKHRGMACTPDIPEDSPFIVKLEPEKDKKFLSGIF